MPQLMQGFPPAAETQVTLANWRSPPFSRWGFQHVREIVPTAEVANAPEDVWTLPSRAVDFGDLRIADGGKGSLSLEAWAERSSTDALVVLHKGHVVLERYRNGMTASTPHILMSVTKSILGLTAGVLASKGVLDPDRPVTDLVPEVKDTAYAGAKIRHLLDMRVGVDFNEDYLASSGPMIAYRKSTNWNPLGPGEAATDLRSFFASMKGSIRPHGQDFHYVSPNTDLMGWVIERAAGKRFSDVVSEALWQPMGAARCAYITVDRLGAPRAAGGLCTTAMDLARVGQLLVAGGMRNGRQVVPAAWIDDIVNAGDQDAWTKGPFVGFFGSDAHYRSKCYVLRGNRPVIFGFGVHGQYLYADPKGETVIARFASEGLPLDADNIPLAMRAFAEIRDFLAKT